MSSSDLLDRTDAELCSVLHGYLEAVDAGTPPSRSAVLARHPDQHEHHDLVLFSNEVFAHTAFEVASLEELLTS